MLNSLPSRRQAATPVSSPAALEAAAPAGLHKSKPPPESGSQRIKRSLPWVLLVIVVYLFINFNSSRMRMNSPAKTVAAATLQGADQCVSTYKSDTTTAQCQPFCNAKHKKFHCAWCKCRLCDFCPKGNEAVVEAGKDAPPPSSPPPPPSADQLADGALMIGTSQVTLDAGVNSSATEAAAVTGASTPANASGLAADSLALVPDDTGALATAPSVGLATQAVQPDANLTGAAEAAAIATAATEVVTTVASSTATANASATPIEAPTNSAQASASAAAEPQKEQVSEWAPEAAADDDYDDEEDDAPAMGEQQQTSDAAAATAGDVFKEVSR